MRDSSAAPGQSGSGAATPAATPAAATTDSAHGGFSLSENFMAGAVAGLIAETIMHPFDTVSHRAKVHPSSLYGSFLGAFRLIYTQEGIRGYFAGVSATLVQSPPSTAVYFATYEYAKSLGFWMTGGQHEHVVYFTAGAMSELFASLVFVPLEVVKSRLQLGANPHRATGGIVASHTNFPSIRAALAGIYAERGMAGLTAGWKSGFVQDMCFSAVQFLVYERLKRYFEDRRADVHAAARARARASGASNLIRRADVEHDMEHKHAHQLHSRSYGHGSERPHKPQLSVHETLLAGSISGGLAAALTNPLDVVTSRLMVQDAKAGYGTGMVSVWNATLREGPTALWRGTIPRVAQTAPLSAIAFAVYEGMRSWFQSARLADNPFV